MNFREIQYGKLTGCENRLVIGVVDTWSCQTSYWIVLKDKKFLRKEQCAFVILNLHLSVARLYCSYLSHSFSLLVCEFH